MAWAGAWPLKFCAMPKYSKKLLSNEKRPPEGGLFD
jgi:hypothetical protein